MTAATSFAGRIIALIVAITIAAVCYRDCASRDGTNGAVDAGARDARNASLDAVDARNPIGETETGSDPERADATVDGSDAGETDGAPEGSAESPRRLCEGDAGLGHGLRRTKADARHPAGRRRRGRHCSRDGCSRDQGGTRPPGAGKAVGGRGRALRRRLGQTARVPRRRIREAWRIWAHPLRIPSRGWRIPRRG